MLRFQLKNHAQLLIHNFKKLTEKYPNFKANIVGLVRKEKFQFFKKDDKLLEGDNVYVVVSSEQLNEILKSFWT